MLSREKEAHYQLKVERNNHVASKYDIKNTSTKLVMLNLSNPSENRIREHSQNKDHLTKEYKCCDCLSNAAPACACHHRDKDLSQYPKRHESCSKENSKKQKNIKTGTFNKNELSEREPKWPSLTRAELISLDKTNRKHQMKCTDGNCCNNDLFLLSSIPALSHPDFTMGQRQCLLSLAKIYTNVSPGPRYFSQNCRQNQSKLAPLSHRSSERKSRSKTGKNVKTNKRSNSKKRKRSLQTAVNLFQSNTIETQTEMESDDKSKFNDSRRGSRNGSRRGSCDKSVTNSSLKLLPSPRNIVSDDEQQVYDEGTHVSIEYSSRCSRYSNSTAIVEKETVNDNDGNEIYELELSNTDLDFILTSYVMNIIQQQANLIRIQTNGMSSEMTFSNTNLENEGLQNNIGIFCDQNIPDDLLDNSMKDALTSQPDKISDKESKELILVNKESGNIIETSFSADPFAGVDGSAKDIQSTINENENSTSSEDIEAPFKQNSNNNYGNPETISKTGSEFSAYSNNLDKINPEIEIIAENPLRMLSNHLRQSISS